MGAGKEIIECTDIRNLKKTKQKQNRRIDLRVGVKQFQIAGKQGGVLPAGFSALEALCSNQIYAQGHQRKAGRLVGQQSNENRIINVKSSGGKKRAEEDCSQGQRSSVQKHF